MIAWDSTFADLRVCTFWLPANTPLARYRMQFRTAQAWSNAQLSIYASSADGVGWYQLDNVVMRADASVTANTTQCYDPRAPLPTSGTDGANLIANSSFTAPITNAIGNWGIFPQDGSVVNQITSGVFEYYRIPSSSSGVVLEDTLQPLEVGSPIEVTFQLGNSTATRQRVTVLVRSRSFSDLTACTFWLEAGTPLGQYAIRTYNTQAWVNGAEGDRTAAISVYASTASSGGWLRLDNVTMRHRPNLSLNGTECYLPGTLPPDVMLSGSPEIVIEAPIPPTLEPTATAQPFAPNEQPLAVTATATVEGDANEGTSGE